MRILAWLGARARWVMPGGILLALMAPGLADLLRPALPGLVCLVLGLSMARLDLREIGRGLAGRRLVALLALTLALMPGWTLALWAAFAWLPEDIRPVILYAGMAPPIASAAGLAFMMGVDARLALEITLVATALTPLLGPAVIGALTALPIEAMAMAVRLALTLLGGLGVALVIRAAAGPARIAAAGRSFDGVVALAMAAFFVSVFEGVGPMVAADPARAAALMGLALLLNSGAAVALGLALRRLGPARSGALGLVAGNRTVALYLAVLPPDPVLALFTALFQIPMSLTPVLGRLLQPRPASA